jgi:hypothetical protein
MGRKSSWQKGQDEREAELKRFADEATVSVWKSDGSTFTDYQSRVTKGLILRQEDLGEKAEKYPNIYRNPVIHSWMLQCRGEYPIEIGDFYYVRLDEAREIAKRLRAGDERAVMDAWFEDTCDDVEAHNSQQERDVVRGLSLAEIARLIEEDTYYLKEVARGPWHTRNRWFMRRRVKVLETIVKRIHEFAKREGFKIRPKSLPAAESERARARRAA